MFNFEEFIKLNNVANILGNGWILNRIKSTPSNIYFTNRNFARYFFNISFKSKSHYSIYFTNAPYREFNNYSKQINVSRLKNSKSIANDINKRIFNDEFIDKEKKYKAQIEQTRIDEIHLNNIGHCLKTILGGKHVNIENNNNKYVYSRSLKCWKMYNNYVSMNAERNLKYEFSVNINHLSDDNFIKLAIFLEGLDHETDL